MLSLLREGRALKKSSELSWAQVVMAANAPMMTKAALVDGRTDVGVLPTGQVVGTIDELPDGRRARVAGGLRGERHARATLRPCGWSTGLGGGRGRGPFPVSCHKSGASPSIRVVHEK